MFTPIWHSNKKKNTSVLSAALHMFIEVTLDVVFLLLWLFKFYWHFHFLD